MPPLLASWMGANSQRLASVSETVFRAGTAVVVVVRIHWACGQEISSPLSKAYSDCNAHEESDVAKVLVDSLWV